MLVAEDRADHIDLNFGCPVPKVTRKGGGAALPWKRGLFRDIVEGAVRAAGDIPLTVKMRKGIDADHLTYLEAGRIAEGAGVAAVALHARTAAEFYSGEADWSAIAKLKETVTSVPVLGNGDIWSRRRRAPHGRRDRLRRRRRRPRMPRPAVAVRRPRRGVPRRVGHARSPTLGEVAADASGATPSCSPSSSTARSGRCRDIRKHVAWYFKGYPVGGELRATLATVESLAQLDDLLGTLDWSMPYPGEGAEGPRGRAGTPEEPGTARGLARLAASSRATTAPRSSTPSSTRAAAERARATVRRLQRRRHRALAARGAHLAPQRLRARPGAAAALERAAPARREDAGAEPHRRASTSPATASPTRSRSRRSAASSRRASASTPTSSTPPASPTTSAIRRSGTTASARSTTGPPTSAGSRATRRPCACSRGSSRRSSATTAAATGSTSRARASTRAASTRGPSATSRRRPQRPQPSSASTATTSPSFEWMRAGAPERRLLHRGAGDGPLRRHRLLRARLRGRDRQRLRRRRRARRPRRPRRPRRRRCTRGSAARSRHDELIAAFDRLDSLDGWLEHVERQPRSSRGG